MKGDIALSVPKLNFEDQCIRTKVMDKNVKQYFAKNSCMGYMYIHTYVHGDMDQKKFYTA